MGNQNKEYDPPKSKDQKYFAIFGDELFKETKYKTDEKYYKSIVDLTYDEAFEKKLANRWWYANYIEFKELLKKKDNNSFYERKYCLYNCIYYWMRIYDIRCLSLLCPRCLRSKNKKFYAFGGLEKDYFENKNIDEERAQYIEEICKVVNDGKIQDEIELLNYFKPKKCNHFFHKDCLKETGNRGCMFCKYYLNEMNLVVFLENNIDVMSLYDVFIRAQLVGDDSINEPLQKNRFTPTLFTCVRNFLKNEKMIDLAIRMKFKDKYPDEKRIILDEEYKRIRRKKRWKKRLKEEEIRKKEEERMEKEKEKEREREREREKNMKVTITEPNYDDEDESYNYNNYYQKSENNYSNKSQKKTGFCNLNATKVSLCKNCYDKKCFICGASNKSRDNRIITLYAHRNCYKGNQCNHCILCNQKLISRCSSGRACRDCTKKYGDIKTICAVCHQDWD